MIIPVFTKSQTPEWNWNNVVRHWVPGDPYQLEHLTEEYYRMKYAVANFVKPQSICEIGVRAGYSAAAFLQAGHTTRYVGIDYDQGTHGGVVGYASHAKTMLAHYDVTNHVYQGLDSQTLTELPDGMYDLLHIDGDHSYRGAYHDIKLGMKSAKWILIDDTDFMPKTVGFAAFDAIRDYDVSECYYVYDRGYRGNILIKNPLL